MKYDKNDPVNSQYFKDYMLRRYHKRQEDLRQLKEIGCSICGETRHMCLEFHHVDPTSKIDNVSGLVKRGFSWDKILEEIEKCVLICSNCHAELEYNKWQEKSKSIGRKEDVLNYTIREPGYNKIIPPDGMGWCSTHKDFLPIDQFHKNNSRWNGIHSVCKNCR